MSAAEASPSPAARLAREAGLERLGRRPAAGEYVRELWQRRHFLLELSRSRFRGQNEENRLGLGWVLVRPLLNAVVYGVVFGLLLASSTRPDNFVPFLVIGIFVFQYFAGCLNDGSKAITSNLGLVRTMHFPRAVLPISVVLQQVYALAPMMGMAAVVALVFGEPLTWRWLLVVPALVLMTMFCQGVAFVAARVTLHVRDVAQLLPFVTRLLFYISGLFYSIERVGLPPAAEAVAMVNPVQVYITLVRTGLLTEVQVGWDVWALGIGWAVVTLVGGAVFFWRAEEAYGRE
ncbi:ABC transporter permease [Pseudokineococcus lusitanus]|uniref:Transport permease protein n=1 Tax=Pseudokineococcus lusitanus TaxID=763993 RepID=A0A3N1G8Y8_9ACTN|nr:ABC transporter permease [Pseudokineococcus lusitanus]ROP26702.1 teichoic acid transport system permease protein [Pseudokineococcus lusitanus]